MQQSVLTGRRANNNPYGSILSQSPINKANNTAKKSDKKIEKRNNNAVDQVSEMRPFPKLPSQIENSFSTEIKSAQGEENVQTDTTPMKRMDESAFKKKQNPINFKQEKFETKNSMVQLLNVPVVISQSSDIDRNEEVDGGSDRQMPIPTMSSDIDRNNKATERSQDVNIQGSQGSMSEEAKVTQKVPSRRTRSARKAEGTSLRPSSVQKVAMPPPDVTPYDASRSNQSRQSVDTQPPEPEFGAPLPTQDSALPFPTELEPDLDMSQIQLEVGDQKQQKHLGDDALQTFTASESMQDFMNQRINLSTSGVKNHWLKELDDSTAKEKTSKSNMPKQYSSKNKERLKQLEQEIKEQSEKLKVTSQKKQKNLDESILTFGDKSKAPNSIETVKQDEEIVVPQTMPEKQLFQQEITQLPLDDRPSSAYGTSRIEKQQQSTGIQPYVKHYKSLDEYSSNFDDKIIQKHMQNFQGIGIETILESEPNFEQTQQIDAAFNNDDPIKFSDLELVMEEPAEKMPFKMPRLDTDVLENIQNGKNQYAMPNTVQSQRAPQSQKSNQPIVSSRSKGTGLLRKKQNQPYPTPLSQRPLNTSRIVKGGGFNSKSSIASMNSKQSNISQMQTQNKKGLGFSASTFLQKAPPKKLAQNTRSTSNLIQSTTSRLHKQSQPKKNGGNGQLPRSQSNLSSKSVRSARSLFSKDNKNTGGALTGVQKNKLHLQSQSNQRLQSEPTETISVEQEAKNFRSVAINPMDTSVQITETDNQSVSSKVSMKDLQMKYKTRMEFYQDFYQNVKSYRKFDPDSHYQDFLNRKEEEERKRKEALDKTNILFRESILTKDIESQLKEERIDRVSNLHKKSNSIASMPVGLQQTARNQSPFGSKVSQKVDTRRMSNQPKQEQPQYIQKHKRPTSAATNPKAPSRPAWGKRQIKPPQTQQRTLYTKAADLNMGLKSNRNSTNQVNQKAQDAFEAKEKILASKRVEQAKQEKYQKEKKAQMEVYHHIKMDLKEAFMKAGISLKDQMWNEDPQEQRQVLVTKSQLHTIMMHMGHLKDFNREPLKIHQQMKLEKQQKSNENSDRKQFQELEERIQKLEQAQFEDCFAMLQDKSMPGVVINMMSLKIFLFTINGLIQDWMQKGHIINPSDLNLQPNEPVKDNKYTDMEKRLLGLNRVYQATTKQKPQQGPLSQQPSVQSSVQPSPTRKDYESTISNSTTIDFQAEKDQDTFMLPNNFLRAAQLQKKLQSQFNHIIHNRKMRKFEDDAKQRVDKLTKQYSRPGSQSNIKAEISKEESKIIAPKIIQEYTVEKNDKFNLTAHELVDTQYIAEPQSLSRQKISVQTTEIDPSYLENSAKMDFMPQSLSRPDRSTNPITERVSIDGSQRVEETEQRRFGHRIQEEFVNSELLIQDINVAFHGQDTVTSSKLLTPKQHETDQSALLKGNLLENSSILSKELGPEVKFIANEEQLVKQYRSQERLKLPDESRPRLPTSPEGEFPTPSQSTPSVLKEANRRDSALEDPILILDIKLVKDKPEKITIYEGDEPEVIVDRFCTDHNLDNVKKSRLLNVIKTQIQEYYDEQQQDDFITQQESIHSSPADRVNYTSNQSMVETSPSKSEHEANSAAVLTRYVSQSLTQIDENVNETENTQEDDQSQNDYAEAKFKSIL